MSSYRDLTNGKYGRLTCVEIVGRYEKGRCALWRCRCDCGNESIVRSNSLLTGNVKSCGCLQREVARRLGRESRKHGMIHSKVYKSWAHMKERCLNPKAKDYKNYGGRGIAVCEEWQKFELFYEWAMANGYRDGLTIERKDNNGNYEPGNCKWADVVAQNNNKRNNRMIAYQGKKMNLSQWAGVLQIKYKTLHGRLACGWSVERALETPTRHRLPPVYVADK